MVMVGVVMLYPFLSVIAMSFSSDASLMAGKVSFYPIGFNVNAYKMVLKDSLVWIAYRNTILYAAGGCVLMLIVTSLAAYPLTFDEFKIKKLITLLYTITMFFGGGLIPTYLWIRQIHLLNTIWVMIIPGCVGAYNVFVFRTFFKGIDKGLREAAYIDGASDVTVLFRIILPLSQALLATFALFSIVGTWNSWFNALIYLRDERMYPLQLVLRRYLFSPVSGPAGAISDQAMLQMMMALHINPKAVQMAIIIIAMLPITLIYPFLQKYFVKGITLGAIKG
jgi:putative aldouronate transport system permease protein